MRAFVLLGVVASLFHVGSVRADASAPTKAECAEADTTAQTERRAQQFHAAREHLELCTKATCPKLVKDDCVQRLNDLDAVTPSIVFVAKDGADNDLAAVRVTMDGALLAPELSGAALTLDPGPHTFRFETAGAPPIEKKFVIREGEKARQERVVFAALNAPAVVPAAVVVPPSQLAPAATSTWGTQKTVAVVAGAAGVIGVAVGAVMGAMSFSAWSSSKSECGATSCPNRAGALSDHDSALTDATVSDVGLIAGGVLVATGVVLYLTAPSKASTTTASVRLEPAGGPGAAGFRLAGSF